MSAWNRLIFKKQLTKFDSEYLQNLAHFYESSKSPTICTFRILDDLNDLQIDILCSCGFLDIYVQSVIKL